MKKAIMELYVAALRSGEFNQIKYQLENREGNCPLGVLCNLAVTEGVCDFGVYNGEGEYDDEFVTLPTSVMEWSGFKTPDGYIKSLKLSISQLNDRGTTFADLADIIEKKYREL